MAEVRTERLVVVDGSGVDRVVLEAGSRHGSVLVRAATARGEPTTGIELYVVDALDGDGPEVGVAVVANGDVVAGLHVPHRAP